MQLFLQLKGDMVLKVIERGQHRDIVIKEGQVLSDVYCTVLRREPWASAHRGKWGQLTPWKKWMKIKNRKHAKKSSFLNVYVIF